MNADTLYEFNELPNRVQKRLIADFVEMEMENWLPSLDTWSDGFEELRKLYPNERLTLREFEWNFEKINQHQVFVKWRHFEVREDYRAEDGWRRTAEYGRWDYEEQHKPIYDALLSLLKWLEEDWEMIQDEDRAEEMLGSGYEDFYYYDGTPADDDEKRSQERTERIVFELEMEIATETDENKRKERQETLQEVRATIERNAQLQGE